MSLNELADALDSYAPDGDGYNTEYSHNLQEAAALLRAAAGADVGDLMALAHEMEMCAVLTAMDNVDMMSAQDPRRPAYKAAYNEKAAALEARLRLLVAQLPRWLPISEAPRDGRTLLLGRFNALKKWRTMRGQWFSAEQIADEWEEPDDQPEGWYETAVEPDPPNCWFTEPTHFQYLPPAPKEPS